MKNNSLELYRFLYCIMVVLLHLFQKDGKWGGGYIAVEFFFILSGYLLARKKTSLSISQLTAGDACLAFTTQKIKRIFPYTLCAFVLYYADAIISGNLDIMQSLKLITKGIWEILYLQLSGVGISVGYLNYPIWYVSALLLAGHLVFFFYYAFDKTFAYVVAPLSAIAIYGFFAVTYGTIDYFKPILWGCIPSGFFRAFAGLSCGVLSYHICEKLAKTKYNSIVEFSFHFAEPLTLMLTLYLAFFTRRTLNDFLVIPAFIIMIAVSSSRKTVFGMVFNHRMSAYLGNVSLSIYLLHIIVYKYFCMVFKISDYRNKALVFLIVVVFISSLFDLLIRFRKLKH